MNRLTRTGDTGRTSKTQQTLQEALQPDNARSETGSTSFVLPSRYEANYQYPLIVWLHHDGGSHQQIVDVLPHISTQNFVAVGVQATRACDAAGHCYQWLPTPMGTAVAEEAIFAAIDAASQRFSIHPQRIYLAGYREGGTMALRVALRNAAQFDGAISIDGALPRGGRPLGNIDDARNLAILAAVSMMGQRYPLHTVCEDLKLWHAASLRMDMRQYTVEDCMVKEVMRDINAWIMRRVTGQPAAGSQQSTGMLGLESMCIDHETTPVNFSNN